MCLKSVPEFHYPDREATSPASKTACGINCHFHVPEALQVGLRRSSLRLLQQTGRTHCKVVKYWNRVPFAVAAVQDQLAFKRQLLGWPNDGDRKIHTVF